MDALSMPWPRIATSRATPAWIRSIERSAPRRSQLRSASGVAGRVSLATSTTATRAPCRASLRAATKPSPPLLPGPQRTRIGPWFQRPAATARARPAAATAVPACSISRMPGTPSRCAFASAPVIAWAVIGELAAASAQRAASPGRSSSKIVASSAGSRVGLPCWRAVPGRRPSLVIGVGKRSGSGGVAGRSGRSDGMRARGAPGAPQLSVSPIPFPALPPRSR